MYIAPDSTIHILQNVPLDTTYANTIHFTSSANQASYFAGKKKYTVSNYTYVRKERVLRVGLLADNLYNCNYIMFQNSAFGNKWFYAFITNVEYVNNETSNISFELDVMQTWYFDYQVLPSFVEREHAATDNIGDNLVPDNLELGDYKAFDFDGTGRLGAYSIVVAATFDGNYDDVSGGMYSGIYSGLYYNVFSSYSDVNDFIDGAVAENKSDGIVSVFMMPTNFVGTVGGSPKTYDIVKTKKVDNIDGYTPKNKKLFTYPYNFLYVTNLDGVGTEYHYEYFSGDSCAFGLAGDMSCNPQVILYPQNYNGVAANYNEKMVLDGFPQCAYTTDSFKAWLAQSGVSQAVGLVGTGVSAVSAGKLAAAGAAGAALGPAAAGLAVAGSIFAVANTLAAAYQHYTLPPHANSSQGNSAMTAMRIKDFAFMHMSIRNEFAKIIDEYWSMYGYPVHRVKLPNISSRKHWNYVKTVNASIVGSVPAEHMAKIKSIYNSGVTFWKNGSEVGHYELDNSIG